MACGCHDCEYKEELYLLKARFASATEQLEAKVDKLSKNLQQIIEKLKPTGENYDGNASSS